MRHQALLQEKAEQNRKLRLKPKSSQEVSLTEINSFSTLRNWRAHCQYPETSSPSMTNTTSTKNATKTKFARSTSRCRTTLQQLLPAQRWECTMKILESEIFLRPNLIWNLLNKKAMRKKINLSKQRNNKMKLIFHNWCKNYLGRIKRNSMTSLRWPKLSFKLPLK